MDTATTTKTADRRGWLPGAAGPPLKFKGILEFLPQFGADDIMEVHHDDAGTNN